jgi:hypothetical protein
VKLSLLRNVLLLKEIIDDYFGTVLLGCTLLTCGWVVFIFHFQQYFSYIVAVSFIGGGNCGVPGENH